MIAGRKLLLADDSAAVQKVIELTFADEGMEVVSVGDGRMAWEELEHVTPDVILADVFMPGLNGYELCRSIKDDERFAQIPVMLLVSSFAPFDEAAAHRAGADDIMTKPFQSIRQLVNRVSSLLAANSDKAKPSPAHSTMGFASTEAPPLSVVADEQDNQSNVTVLVEAAQLAPAEAPEASGSACAPDIEFQTADTARLERVFDEPAHPISPDEVQIEYAMETEPVVIYAETAATPVGATQVYANVAKSDESRMTQTQNQSRTSFDSALLDLDESDFSATSLADDMILDLDFAEPVPAHGEAAQDAIPAAMQPGNAPVTTPEVMSAEEMPEPARGGQSAPEVDSRPVDQGEAQSTSTTESFSAETIDAIARRVIEQMSDKIVREIAWEVVPELSELLIKKKLENQK